jgi:hypothetical protein
MVQVVLVVVRAVGMSGAAQQVAGRPATDTHGWATRAAHNIPSGGTPTSSSAAAAAATCSWPVPSTPATLEL